MTSLLDPAVLFFFLGIFARLVKSNLEIPGPLAKFFSLYLLMSIGFKGGASLALSGFTPEMALALLVAALMAFLVPVYTYGILRRRLNPFDAAAVAATYGSVSAVTFIAANGYAERLGLPVGGYMPVALVLMESPAIIMAVLLAQRARARAGNGAAGAPLPTGRILHEAFTDGAQLLLLGSLLVGFLTGGAGLQAMLPFIGDIQKGVLAFFLLEMGLLVGARAGSLREHGTFLTAFGILVPLVNATAAGILSRLLGLPLGDAFLLSILAASASYIVVPAVVRYAIPEANPSLYFGMSLVITFPFNIVVGIPLYYSLLARAWT